MNSIKISFYDDVRRVKVDLTKPNCFENTVQQFKASFNLPAQAAVVLKYHDDEEELITVSSSAELAEAARVCADLGRKNLKLFAFISDSPAPAPAAVPAAVGDNEDAKSDVSFVDVPAVSMPKPAPLVEDVKLAPPVAVAPIETSSDDDAAKSLKAAQKEERKARKQEERAARKVEKAAAQQAKLAAKEAKLAAKQATKLNAESSSAATVADAKVEPLEVKLPAADAKPVHPTIRCDGCDMFPLVGSRFKCTTCRNFDLCEACEAKAVHPVDHVLLKINRPPATVDEQGRAIHRNVTCNGCNQHPLVGARFKCSVCDDYDLCEACEGAGKHTAEHPLLKIREPLEHRASRHVDRFCHRRLPDFLTAAFGPAVTATVSESKPGEPDNEVTVELSCPVRSPSGFFGVRGPRAPRCRRESKEANSDSEDRPKHHRHHYGRKGHSSVAAAAVPEPSSVSAAAPSPVPAPLAAPVVVPVPMPAPAPAPIPVAPAVVAQAPAPAPAAPVASAWRRPPKFKFHEQLQTLNGMGFTHYDACIKALVATNGDVNAAIERLLN